MQTPHVSPVFWVNCAIGGTILAVLWYVTRHVSNPWLRHLPRAVVGSLTFVPSVMIEEITLLPALMAPHAYVISPGSSLAKQLWAFAPPVVGAVAWWLGAVWLWKVQNKHRPPDRPSPTTAPTGSAAASSSSQTRMLLWSLTPLLAFLVVAVSYKQLTDMASRHEGGPILLICLITALAHCILGFLAFRLMKESGAQWRLVVAALFSLLGALVWFCLLVTSMLALMMG